MNNVISIKLVGPLSEAAKQKVREYTKRTGVSVGTVVTGVYGGEMHTGQVAEITTPQEGTEAFEEGKVNVYLWFDRKRVLTVFFPGEYVWKGRLIAPEALQRAIRQYAVVRATSQYTERMATLRGWGGEVKDEASRGTVAFHDAGEVFMEPLAQDPLKDKLDAWLMSEPVVLGDQFSERINQADRDCEVIEIKKTRYRIEFEMPTCVQQGWRTGVRVAGKVFYKAQA